jgi:hypothetical protein
MSVNSKKATGWAIILVVLGIAALYGGSRWLTLLIPAAMLVWHGAGRALRSGSISASNSATRTSGSQKS